MQYLPVVAVMVRRIRTQRAELKDLMMTDLQTHKHTISTDQETQTSHSHRGLGVGLVSLHCSKGIARC